MPSIPPPTAADREIDLIALYPWEAPWDEGPFAAVMRLLFEARAEVERLRAALKPFAETPIIDDSPDDGPICWWCEETQLELIAKVRDVRLAAALLPATPEG